MITIKVPKKFDKTITFFDKLSEIPKAGILDKYGQRGVDALQKATPVDSGKTSQSWRYEIETRKGQTTIYWCNDNINDNVNIAVILQYGHGTGTGGMVKGVDYINPAMRDIFENIANDAWEEVKKL